MKRTVCAAAVMAGFAACSLLSSVAVAQTAPARGAAAPAGGTDDARMHYERGLQLYNDENYAAALLEFERAYALSPTYRILYNMARIQRHQNNYAAALQNYERYLAEGGTGLAEDKRKEVEKEIAALKPRVATITIKVSVAGADVFIDDAPLCSGTAAAGCVGTTPIPKPVTVNPGNHKIIAKKKGFSDASAIVTVLGSDTTEAKLDLVDYATMSGPVDPAPRNRALGAWAVTLVMGIGTAVTGGLALSNSSKLKDEKATLDSDPGSTTKADAMSSYSSRMTTFALAADVFAGLTVVGAGFATYFTVKATQASKARRMGPEGDQDARAKPVRLRVDVGPSGAAVFGAF